MSVLASMRFDDVLFVSSQIFCGMSKRRAIGARGRREGAFTLMYVLYELVVLYKVPYYS